MRLRRSRPITSDPAAEVAAVPFWWHSIDVGSGVTTPGFNPPEFLEFEWWRMDVGDLRGKSVIDIGAWDGYFSFRAEDAGAKRVVALDHYVWSLDLGEQQAYWRKCMEDGTTPRPYHELDFWMPDLLPGKIGFDTAKRLRESKVESVAEDFMTIDTSRLGTFDVAFYLGVLYHIEEPFEALKRLARITREMAVISTQAIWMPEHEDRPLWEFFPGSELNNDVSNWWAPNLAGLVGMCRAAGFRDVRTVVGTPDEESGTFQRYRAVVHAYH